MKNLFRLLISLASLGLSIGLSFSAQAQNAQAGEKKASLCIGCHGIQGYQASFPEIYKVPMIAGQNAKYLASALAGYKKGERKHPVMRGIAASLSDQDMLDLAAFYEQLGKTGAPVEARAVPQAPADVAALLKKGNCASCHGENFNKPIDPSYPKLAGQHGDYLAAALREYQTDKNPQVGRNNAIMMGMARPFTHAETKLLAAYFASLPGDLKTVSQSSWR